MKALALYVLATGFLIVIGLIGWSGWRGAPLGGGLTMHASALHTVTVGEGGDTIPGVAGKLGISAESLAKANDLAATATLDAGTELTVPPEATDWREAFSTHAAGLGAAFIGVFMSFWLSLAVGIVAKGYRAQIFSISFVLALASYAATQASAAGQPVLTPQFLFASIKDGFAWSSAFPMFAWALGIRDRKGGAGGATGGTGGSTSPAPAARRPAPSDAGAPPAPAADTAGGDAAVGAPRG